MGKIVLTGATGRLGDLVVRSLLDQKVNSEQIAVIVRNREKAQHLAKLGLEVRFGDYENADSMMEASRGADKFLFISSPSADDTHRIRQHANVVEAIRDAEVGQIIYTSFAFSEKLSIGLQHVHIATEQAILTTGIPYTFLRNGFYMDMLINPSLLDSIEAGELVTSTGGQKLNYVMRKDLAKAAAKVLVEDGHQNKSYELSNPTPFSYDDLTEILTNLSGKRVKHNDVAPAKAYQQMMDAGASREAADFIVHRLYESIGKGEFSYSSEDLSQLIGKVTTVKEAVQSLLTRE